ncbi:serine protease Do [Amphibacillus marinus]|uniref:Serine protease Do n=1 Tax=Amphibacillus marinus TaxID=872970 RepID=A0A1H8PKC7_9BACI|nr:trypsin-like peptidase domain-containing protein [Amphibacillus marinus]SEO42365.1 serine protease Do [Amphibacillus marinus]
MVYFDDGTSKRRRGRYYKNRSFWLLYLIIGIVLGAFLFAVALPKLVENNWLPYQVYVGMGQGGGTAINSNHGQQDAMLDYLSPVNVDISTQVTDIVDRVMPAVVGVENIQTQRANFWEQATYDGGTGSGVIYRQDDDVAFIVTNHHVIEGADQIEIILEDGTRLLAELVGSDLFTDLAVLSVDGSQIDVVIEIGNSDISKVGEPVIAIGNPLGLDLSGSVTQGIISGKQRSIPMDFSGDGRADWQADVIQTDAAINPGNSGGALINMSGQLIGINSMKIAESSVEGIGFAIPIDEAIPVITELEQNGQMTRAFLGVEAYSLIDVPQVEWRRSLNLPNEVEGGIYIQSVEPLSPADQADLQPYDVIIELDGEPVYTIVDLRKHLYQEKQPGESMRVTFYREGERQQVTIELSTQ